MENQLNYYKNLIPQLESQIISYKAQLGFRGSDYKLDFQKSENVFLL